MMGYNMSSSSLVHCHALLPHVQPKRRTRLSNTLRFEHRFIEQYTIHVLPVLASSAPPSSSPHGYGAGWSVALSYSANTLYRKAAESAGVHPLYLDSISGKFAIQIEQAQSIAELASLHEEMPQVYCSVVRELSVAALPSIVKEAVTYIRFNIDQPLSLN